MFGLTSDHKVYKYAGTDSARETMGWFHMAIDHEKIKPKLSRRFYPVSHSPGSVFPSTCMMDRDE